jgi:hypothetical protein
MDADGGRRFYSAGRDAVRIRRSRVVLMPRRWHQAGEDACAIRAGDGGKKARFTGKSAYKPLKPFACGNAG